MLWLVYSSFSCSTIGEPGSYFQCCVSTNIVDNNILVHIYLCAISLVSTGTNSTLPCYPQAPPEEHHFLSFGLFLWRCIHVHI